MSILTPVAGLSLLLIATLAGLALLAFEIFMFLDVLKNPKLRDTDKLLWAAGMLLIHPVVAIVYYFILYSKRVR